MNLLVTTRVDAFIRPGGDTNHLLQTVSALKMLGIDWTSQLDLPRDFSPDLIHHFNLNRPDQALEILKQFKKAPLVISSIFVDYSEIDQISNRLRIRLLTKVLSSSRMEWMKEIARSVMKQRSWPPKEYLIKGHANSVQQLLNRADLLLVASQTEAERIFRIYGVQQLRTEICLPPVHLTYFSSSFIQREVDVVLCVARFEPLKNQLQLIKALNNTRFKLKLIGDSAPNHLNYFKECKEVANSNIEFYSFQSEKELFKEYASASVHILPSLFETTGLSTLEAMACGCPAVVGGGEEVKEIFGDRVEYINPKRINSIIPAIERALLRKKNQKAWVYKKAHPEVIASRLVELYQKVLSE